MGKVTGFLEYRRAGADVRDRCAVRLRDWREVYEPQSDDEVAVPGGALHGLRRPVLHAGLSARQSDSRRSTTDVCRGHWVRRPTSCSRTNNFPEFTGRLCPAPCESACVLGISRRPGHHRAHRVRGRRTRLRARLRRRRATAAAETRLSRGGRRLGAGGTGRRGPACAAPVTPSTSTSEVTPSAGCCATASPSSRWRRPSSIDASR